MPICGTLFSLQSWCNVSDSAQGVYELLESKGGSMPEPTGLQVLVHGVVPLGEMKGRRVLGADAGSWVVMI